MSKLIGILVAGFFATAAIAQTSSGASGASTSGSAGASTGASTGANTGSTGSTGATTGSPGSTGPTTGAGTSGATSGSTMGNTGNSQYSGKPCPAGVDAKSTGCIQPGQTGRAGTGSTTGK